MSLLIKALDKAEKDQAQFGKNAKTETAPELNTKKSPPASEWALTSIQNEDAHLVKNAELSANLAANQPPNVASEESTAKTVDYGYGRQKPSDAFDTNNIDVNSLADFGISSANLKNSQNKIQHSSTTLRATQLNAQVTEQAKMQAEQDLVSANQRVLAANVFTAKQTEPKNTIKLAWLSLLALACLCIIGISSYAYFIDNSILNGTPLYALFTKSKPIPQISLAQNDIQPDRSTVIIASPLPTNETNNAITTVKAIDAPISESVMMEPPAAGNYALKNQAPSAISSNDLVTQSAKENPANNIANVNQVARANQIAQTDVSSKVISARKSKQLEQNNSANDALSNQDEVIAYNTTKPQKALLSSRSSTITVTKNRPVNGVNPILQNAYAAYTNGEDTKAQRLYKQVLQTDTRNVDAMLGLAAIAQKQNRMDDAAGWYRKVIELDPKNPFAQASLASNTLSTQLQSNGAEDMIANESRLKNLIAQQPDNASLQAALGSYYADQNQWPSAQQAYFEAYRLAPNNADFAFNLAASLDQMGKQKLALPYYKRALEQQLKSGNSQIDAAAIRARINVIQ